MNLKSIIVIPGWIAFSGALLTGQPFSPTHDTRPNSEKRLVGVAKVDITPTEPIRLSGFGSREKVSEGVEGRLWAKALAIGAGEEPVILVTLDLIGVPDWLTAAVVDQLGLPESHVALCATHTHSGPHLKEVLDPIFMADIPSDHWEAIERYSKRLIEQVVIACRMAINNRQAGSIEWGQGAVDFAGNRRVLENGKWTGFGTQPDGPVDHSLPIMKVTDSSDALLAILANYACHCTTLGGQFNHLHGDWAGAAQQLLEERHPGTTAMIAIGCGADSNPNPRGTMDDVLQHGKSLADEVDRLLQTKLTPLATTPVATLNHITLPFDPLPSREEWEKHAASGEKTAYYARKIIERMDRGESIPTSMDYPIQTWTFGKELAMVFLAGEVVVDYSLKLKERFDAKRLWVNAYANAAPSYIASRRLYDEGGYEVDRSMYYYDKPARLSPDTEDLVLDEVLKQLPYPFYSDSTLSRIPAPVEKEQSLATLVAHPRMRVDLVAAEPLVMDPIDIAWGPDGKLWVVEMADYPLGIDGNGKPGGRVRFLEDDNDDGIYDSSTLFLDGLRYPTSVFPWRDGVLVTSPPDIIFARDTNDDGKADELAPLYSGFYVGNQQHLVNGMQWGLDGWIYLANGDSGGEVHSWKSPEKVRIDNLDIKILPGQGKIETILGRTQFGRNRDSWGNWFGNSNSWPGWHYALDDSYLKRNPHIAYPSAKVYLPEVPQAGPVYPVSKTLSRYNDYEKSNRFTSASGFMIYEDAALGEDFMGNSFICESVHNLVSRAIVYPKGFTYFSRRAPEEQESEFLASTDNWFRPTAVRSGPDGALYIVDMYRFVIEHPEWVPQDWQRKLNLREGHDKGRIYRVSLKGKSLRKAPALNGMTTKELVGHLDSNNRWQRDTVQQLLLWKRDVTSLAHLERITKNGSIPAARGQALWTLHGLNALSAGVLLNSLSDPSPGVRRQAVRLSEPFLTTDSAILASVLKLATDEGAALRQQVAYSLGETDDPSAGRTLSQMLQSRDADPLMQYSILSSILPHGLIFARENLKPLLTTGDSDIAEGVIQTLLGSGTTETLRAVVSAILPADEKVNFTHLGLFLNALKKNDSSLRSLLTTADEDLAEQLQRINSVFQEAEKVATNSKATMAERKSALSVLSYPNLNGNVRRDLFFKLLTPESPVELQLDAISHLAQSSEASPTKELMNRWNRFGPSVRRKVFETLLKRQNSTRELLDYAATHPDILSVFSAAQMAYLASHANQQIADLAEKLFGARVSGDRRQVIKSFQPALALHGDGLAGRSIFNARCATCHTIGDLGQAVGPDLTSLTDKSPQSLLVGILDPNQAVEDKFTLYTVTTKDGHSAAGIISSESSTSITLTPAGGLQQTFLRSQIQTLEGGSNSLMPEGLEIGINHQAMADLIAFLNNSDPSLKIRPEADGSVALTAARGKASGPSVYFNQEQESFDRVSDRDTLEWTVYDLKAGYYDIFSDAALATEYEGRPFTLTVNDTFVTGAVVFSGGIDRFRKRKFGNILIEETIPKAEFKLRHSLDDARFALKELRMIPVR